MIESILDQDLYKFSVSWAYMKLYPEARGCFKFTDRNNECYNEKFVDDLKDELSLLSFRSLSIEEFSWCKSTIPYIPKVYWEWLSGFTYNPDKIYIELDNESHINISITGNLYEVTLYEVPILATFSEVYNRRNKININEAIEKLDTKIEFANLHHLNFSEFGTRRRFSFLLQDLIIDRLKQSCRFCTGTSNVYFAMKYNMKPMGTFPHEWVMFHGAIWGYQEANYLSMRDWVRVYDGDLGIFLMDTYTSKVGLRNMSKKYAKLFDGVRQDSGDEYEIGNMVIERYKELGIDPTTKTIVFSNALTFDKYLDIYRYFNGRIRVSAGIGTNLTNDTGSKPCNIVMKLSKCQINYKQDWRDCIKISDDLGKYLGNSKEFEIAKYQLGL